jgi:NADPH:quinone reductase-like Zn-dependent oxidoreductase
MKAVRIRSFGGPDVLKYEDVPLPQPGAGEIRIRVIAAGVNLVDWKIRQGYGNFTLPMTMGVDVSGVVDAVGEKEKTFEIGDNVYAKVTPGQGGYAEYTVTDASQAAAKPKSIGFVEAAAIPTAGLAAWQAIFDTAGLKTGQSILVHGAAGGVGSFAVQLAKWKGAFVIGTASGDHTRFVKELGADQVIDYKAHKFEDVVHDLDVVMDTVGGDTFDRSWSVLKPGGFLVTTVAMVPEGAAASHSVGASHIVTQPDGKELADIAELIDEGYIKPQVTLVLPLAQAKKAQELSESQHTKGKIVLRVAEDPK